MSVYKKAGCATWTMDFLFHGQRILESTGVRSKTRAKEVERKRRQGLEDGSAGIRKRASPRILSVAAQAWLDIKRAQVAPRTLQIEQQNLKHLLPQLGKLLVCDIEARDVARYQQARLGEGASPKTVNLELGTLRAILKRSGAWARIQPDVRMLPASDDVGRAISAEEEQALLASCAQSRSRSLRTFVALGLAAGVRYGVIRTLTWGQVNLEAGTVRWGKDKTAAGTGNAVPLSSGAIAALRFWAEQFPGRQPDHFVFPSERAGGAGKRGEQGTRADAEFCGGFAYATDPTRPVGDIKEGWEAAKKRAGVKCRFHDLRHTAASRLLAAGKPLPIVAKLLGWSPATAVRMAARYGHFSEAELRQAVEATALPETVEIGAGSRRFPRLSAATAEPKAAN